MTKKGIILAGGNGSRLYPATRAINKHLLPINGKPMIYYSLSILMLSKIKDIQIVVNPGEKKSFQKVIGSFKDLGIKISFITQKKPNGIAEIFKISKKFIGSDKFALILGDNFFYGQGLTYYLKKIKKIKKNECIIFTHPVKNISSFGCLEKTNKKFRVIEKPKKSKSNLAVTGLYAFDYNSIQFAKNQKKSNRGELEIADIINSYADKNKLKNINIGRGTTWFDMGTIDDFLKANNFVDLIEKENQFKISCLEEIAFKNKWIDKKNIQNRINFYGKDHKISKYLVSL